MGRPPTLTAHQQRDALRALDGGASQADQARRYNVSQATISRLVNHELRTAARLWRASRAKG
jgi:hypothetical protein